MTDAGVYNVTRFVAAALAMLGRLASGAEPLGVEGPKVLAQQAVASADALLAELGLTKEMQ